jgi:hypothetical protein
MSRVHALGLLVALTACAAGPEHPPRPIGEADYPGALVPVTEIPGAFLWRQQIAAEYGPRTVSFEAVLQKKDDRLVVLGLTPYGTRAFVIEQTGTSFTFTNHLPPEHALPFPPRSILLDIHRAWFMALPGGPKVDGEHAGDREGERITEVWRGGRVVERRYRRLNDLPVGEIAVRYGKDGMTGLEPPDEVVLDNRWFGYRLVVRTVERRDLR